MTFPSPKPAAATPLRNHSGPGRVKVRVQTGFSLIEVVIALGIISFCLVAMLGLLAVAANSGRESVDRTESSLLFAKVVNQLKLKPFEKEQVPDSADRTVFPLPSLRVLGSAQTFLVDDQNLYAGTGQDGESLGTASRLIRLVVLDSPDLEINAMDKPTAVTVGQLAYVRVEIWSPAAAYHPETPNSAAAAVFYTEISPLEQ